MSPLTNKSIYCPRNNPDSGTVENAYDYQAFGEPYNCVENVENRYTYTGREYDSESGTDYYRARQYHYALGIFGQRDSIEHTGLYRYVTNNPVLLVDPMGLSELSSDDYQKFIKDTLDKGDLSADELFKKLLKHYLENDPEDDLFWDCEDDMEEIFDALGEITYEWNKKVKYAKFAAGGNEEKALEELPSWAKNFTKTLYSWKDLGVAYDKMLHFFGGMELGATYGYAGAYWGARFWETYNYAGSSPGGYDTMDVAWGEFGASFVDYFDTWSECDCRELVKMFTGGEVCLSGYAQGGSKYMDDALAEAKRRCCKE